MSLTLMQAAERVSPLSVLVRSLLERALPAEKIQQIVAAHADQTYTKKLTLETLVGLCLEVILGTAPALHHAAKSLNPPLAASQQALYTKLGRTPVGVSQDLLEESAAELLPLALSCLPAAHKNFPYQIKILDCTKPNGSEHRLSVLRTIAAAGLPATFAVVLDQATGICQHVVASEDAYAADVALSENLLPLVQSQELYLADRAFSAGWLMQDLDTAGAFFIIREHNPQVTDEQPLQERGTTEAGRLREQQVVVENQRNGEFLVARRVLLRLQKPLPDGTRELRWLTNLPESVSAKKIAELYRERWGIERCFARIKHDLHGEIPSLGEPRTTILMLCLAMVAYNALAVTKFLSAVTPGGIARQEISDYCLVAELTRGYAAIDALLGDTTWNQIRQLTSQQFWKHCCDLAKQVRWHVFQRSVRGPKKPPPKRQSGKDRHHYATYRLQQERK